MVPPWQAREWRQAGVTFTTALDAPAKPAHGRRERRELWALADPDLNAYLSRAEAPGAGWPRVQQVGVLRRERTTAGATTRTEVYLITSLPPTQADARRLLAVNRRHWGIENRLHWIRDVTFDEDRSQIRSGSAPQVVAGLRNLTIALLRRAHRTNIAGALRTYAARPAHAVALVLATNRP